MQEDHLTDVQTYSNNFTGTTCTHMLLENYKQTHGNQFSLQNKWMNNYLKMYFSAIGDNLLSAYLFLWCFF